VAGGVKLCSVLMFRHMQDPPGRYLSSSDPLPSSGPPEDHEPLFRERVHERSMGCPVSLALHGSGILPGRAACTNHRKKLLHRDLRPCRPTDPADASRSLALSRSRPGAYRAPLAGSQTYVPPSAIRWR